MSGAGHEGRRLLAAGGAFGATAVVVAGVGLVGGPLLLLALLTPIVLEGFARRAAPGTDRRAALAGALAAVIAVFGLRALLLVRANVATPPEWDFECFWLYGRAAVSGLDLYGAETLRNLAAGRPHSPELERAVLAVGFPYPPPTILLFWPLGWLPLRGAYVAWALVQGLALAAAVVVLARGVRGDREPLALLFVGALALMLRATSATIAVAQTNFLLLLALALYGRDRNAARGGTWLALAAVVKPLGAILLLEPLLRRRWRVLAAAAATLGVLAGGTALLVGPEAFPSYLRAGAAARQPGFVWNEPENQSLLATVLRATGTDPEVGPRVGHPLFVVLAGGLGLATAWLVARLPPGRDAVGTGLVLALALLVYPASLQHYAVLLLCPWLWIWCDARALGLERRVATALVSVAWLLVGVPAGAGVFVANAYTWFVCAALAARGQTAATTTS